MVVGIEALSRMLRRRGRFGLVACTPLLLTGCLGTKYLEGEDKLLTRQKITGLRTLDKENVQSVCTQRPNQRILWLPWALKAQVYESSKASFDSVKYAKKLAKQNKKQEKILAKAPSNRREKQLRQVNRKQERLQRALDKKESFWTRIGEPLAVYDTAKTNRSVARIAGYLENNGFFHAQVRVQEDVRKAYVRQTFHIEEHTPHRLRNIGYKASPAIMEILEKAQKNSVLQADSRYQYTNMEAERTRLYRLLKNHGYYGVEPTHIYFEMDTLSTPPYAMDVQTHIKMPHERTYVVDSITVSVPDEPYNASKMFRGVHILHKKYHRRLFRRHIFLDPEAPYALKRVEQSKQSLSSMDLFDFIRIRADTLDGRMHQHITIHPKKHFLISTEPGFEIGQGIPSPFLLWRFKSLNLLRSLEVLELSLKGALNGVTTPSRLGQAYNSYELGYSVQLAYPGILFPLPSKWKDKVAHTNPRSTLTVGLDWVNRVDYRHLRNFLQLEYSWQRGFFRYSLRVLDVNVVDFDILPSFRGRFASFLSTFSSALNPSFITSTAFSLHWNKNYKGFGTDGKQVHFSVESGGNSTFLYDKFLLDRGLSIFQFAKVDLSYTQSFAFDDRHTLAYRVRLGVALPYSRRSALPYEKYFFAGGSNSIRAWRPRRLGPGGYTLSATESILEQPGDILFEVNLEYRGAITQKVQWATFLDAGNIWFLRPFRGKPRAHIRFPEAFEEIALGGGVGFRFNFYLVLFRLDMAMQFYNPNLPPGIRWGLPRTQSRFPFIEDERLRLNFSIGYPF